MLVLYSTPHSFVYHSLKEKNKKKYKCICRNGVLLQGVDCV